MKTIIVECINPTPVDSHCEAAGKRRYYTQYEFPANVTSAIGIGASGRTVHGFADSPAPRLVCEDHGTYLIATQLICPNPES